MKGLILFAHGARDSRWAQPFERLQTILQARQPARQVALAYLELMSPRLPASVADMVALGILQIDIAPMFLGVGAHIREDFPRIVADLRAQYPQVEISVLPVLGESETLLQGIADWVVQGVEE
ncbi:MAG: CbiX/SirB N-terminal domain-containing protein [Sulfuriferula sp.]|nr:CbiX/SirB N-terminal domain-containing protein [Sulfuriferula sp.]